MLSLTWRGLNVMRRLALFAGHFALIGLVAVLVVPARSTVSARPPQEDTDAQHIEEIIDSLSPQERVGQLMLVTFEGSNLSRDTSIAQLIGDYNIGGVVLLAENDNINGQVNTPRLVLSLTRDIQQTAYDSAQADTDGTQRAFVPLFIATTHSGNGSPRTQIASDTTPLPSYMALGATWNPGYARQVGQIAGAELTAMGVNMLFGPALDVAQQPGAERTLDLGVNTFGGEPYWVGQMGQAYVTGVHEGGMGRIAVIAQHFPGLGLADTQPDYEIPVVPRAVDDLAGMDLIPYFDVTGHAKDTLATVDGMQCANIRYQGENIRSITRPVCIDERAANQLLSLDPFEKWRTDGLMVSSSLGTRAIRRFYNVTPFPHRQVAREALLAGNDLLYLADFGPESGDDQLANVLDVLHFFAERYENDPVFRARVDESLHRILRLKLRLYGGDLSLDNVLTSANPIDRVGSDASRSQMYSVAEQSVTLLAPRRESLAPPPGRDDNIVVFTDVRLVQQCSYCPAYPLVTVNALEVAIERMYGPYAGALIKPEQVVSFSFAQLQSYLQGDQGQDGGQFDTNEFKTVQRIGEALRNVDWIVFVMLDVSPDVEVSSIVRRLLESDSSIVERSRVVGIALGAPTYLSSTEVSKFAAFYGLFSNTPPYIDAAARALFQESSFPGAPPISVPAVGYDVTAMTAPDPSQIVQLEMSTEVDGIDTVAAGPDVVTVPVGHEIELRTRPLADRNGHTVPDDVQVEFALTFVTDNLQTRQYALTVDGVARTMFKPVRSGRIQITANTSGTSRSMTLQLVVVDDQTQIPAATISLSEDRATQTASALVVADGLPDESGGAGEDGSVGFSPNGTGSTDGDLMTVGVGDHGARLGIFDFVLALFGLALMSAPAFFVGRAVTLTMQGGVRVVLGSLVAGLTGYIYYGFGGPGVSLLHERTPHGGPLLTTVAAAFVGCIYAWWLLRREVQQR